MAGENDQTRWIGIRPTNPAENIPVTESAPLTAIQVEPKPGAANFPVTESAPLAQIKVEPLAVGTEFKTLTKKRSPAIADLQAPETLVRAAVTTVAIAGTNTVDVYTVPAGKLFVMQLNIMMCNFGTPTDYILQIDVSGTSYIWWASVYGAGWSTQINNLCLLLNAGEKVQHRWNGCGAGNSLFDKVLGYTIDQY